MEASNEPLWEFLLSLGTDKVAHTGGDFLHHLRAVENLLNEHSADQEVVKAGLFHSIYGTQGFQDFSLPLAERDTIQNLIGTRAEFIAFCNCVMDRDSFDSEVAHALTGRSEHSIRDRVSNQPIAMNTSQLADLAQVHLFDWLEQVERSDRGWDYRRSAYRNMATLVGPDAETLYEEVFAREDSQLD